MRVLVVLVRFRMAVLAGAFAMVLGSSVLPMHRVLAVASVIVVPVPMLGARRDDLHRDELHPKADIAEGCGLPKNGGATDHIRGLVALDLLEEQAGRYRTGRLDGALFARVAALVGELEHVPDIRIDEVLEGKVRG
jgi:hypothetical protein